MIRLRQVSKRISGVEVLAGIDFDLDRGGALVVAGTNGSGRSTLLAVLATLVRPDSGRVEIDGLDARTEPLRVRQRIGYLGSQSDLHPRLSAREHLAFVASSRGLEADERERAVDLALASLDAAPDRPIHELSSGLRRQIALAGALVGEPPLLLLDEPLCRLDPLARHRFGSALEARRRSGATVVLACNGFDLPAGLRERVVFLHQGRLVADRRLGAESDPAEVLAALVESEEPVRAEAPAGSEGDACPPVS